MKNWLSKRLFATIAGFIVAPKETIAWLLGLIGVYVVGETLRPTGVAAVGKIGKQPPPAS